MKATATCPKCDSKRIMRVTAVADATGYNGSGTEFSARQACTPVRRRLLVKITKTPGLLGPSEARDPTGDVEAYVCADCGYFEEYVANPARIDWDRILGALPHSAKGGGPYR
jgi:predicted nucleic-acid-binding Zn-ribbon protein